MILRLTILGLILTVLVSCGRLGDTVINLAERPVCLKVTVGEGEELARDHDRDLEMDIRLNPNEVFTTDPSRNGHHRRIQHVEAIDIDGHMIGAFDKHQVPNRRGRYGRFVAYVVLNDGIYPVPRKKFNVRADLNRESLEKALQDERAYDSVASE